MPDRKAGSVSCKPSGFAERKHVKNGDTTVNTAEEENTDTALLMRLLHKPEMAQLLKTLAQSL